MTNYVNQQCPNCNYNFMAGFTNNNIQACPKCKKKFSLMSGNFSGTNNVYYSDGCPALMSDGRFITYYGSTNELTQAMQKMNGITSSNKFRNFLQQNGDNIINAERNYALRENTCNPSIACSEGWYDLWNKNEGNWSNFNN